MKKTKIISLILSAILAVGTFTASMPVSAATTTSSVTASTKTPSKSKLKISAMSKAKKTISLSWTKSTNAKEYIILSSFNGGAYTTIDTTTKLKYTYNVPEDGVYKFKIRAVNGTKTKTSNIVKKTVVWYSDGADFLNKGTFILDGEKMKLPDTYYGLYDMGYYPKNVSIQQTQNCPRIAEIECSWFGQNVLSKDNLPKDDYTCIEIVDNANKEKNEYLVTEIGYQCRYYDFDLERFVIPENALKIYFAKGLNYNSTLNDCIKAFGQYSETSNYNQRLIGAKDEWGNNKSFYGVLTTYYWVNNDYRIRVVFNENNEMCEFSCIYVYPTVLYYDHAGWCPYGQELCNYDTKNYGRGLLEEETTD